MWLLIRILLGSGLAVSGLVITGLILVASNNNPSQDLEVIPLMTYRAAIDYFVTARPASANVKKGAILREAHQQGYLVSLVFLNEANEIISQSGRRMIVQQFDEELAEAFRNTNMIVMT